MKRTIYTALAVTVALPVLAVPAAAQQDRYGRSGEMPYEWSEQRGAIMRDDRASGAYRGSGDMPNPPYTPERYITDWDQPTQGRDYPNPPRMSERYGTDQGGYGGYDRRAGADDRWSEREPPDRSFDRPAPPPGYARGWQDERDPYAGRGWGGDDPYAGYGRDRVGPRHGGDRGDYARGWRDERDPYAGRGWGGPDPRMSARMREMHEEMRARHHGGRRDMDFRRDFSQDGRRGYYQDPSYEEMPAGDRRMHRRSRDRAGSPGMGEIRRAMRMIERFDVDQDGRVTQDEVDQYRADRLAEFDADGDRELTIDEYGELWADAMRERMVRRFQSHDRDGDGVVTVAEFSEQTGDVVRMRDRNRDDSLSEDDFMRPRVAAPMGGSPNEPAESEAAGDDDRASVGTRPTVEAPLDGTPDDDQTEEVETEVEEQDDTSDTTTN